MRNSGRPRWEETEVPDAGVAAMASVGRMVQEVLAEESSKWSFVLVCRREGDEEWGDDFESSVSDLKDPDAVDLLIKAAQRLHKRGRP